MTGGESEELENGRAEELGGRYVAGETVELLLPPKVEYVPVLRAVVGVVAGTLSFNYDEIIAIRVAVSEALGLVLRHIQREGLPGDSGGIKAGFVIGHDSLKVVLTAPGPGYVDTESAKDMESQAVLESLVDSVEIGVEGSGERVITLVKYRGP